MNNTRVYGREATIHRTGHLNIEVGPDGIVVGVWFRCQHLPFKVTKVDEDRADDMRRLYEDAGAPELASVEVGV